MSFPHMLMWATVLAVGVLSAWRNPTAGALVLSWIVVEAIFVATGNNLAVEYYIFPDIFVLAVIFAKPRYHPCEHYLGTWHQIKCLLLERTPSDRVVMLIYPCMWVVYVADIHPYYAWWGLYALVLAQFFAAAWESLQLIRRDADAVDRLPVTPGDLLVAYPGGGRS